MCRPPEKVSTIIPSAIFASLAKNFCRGESKLKHCYWPVCASDFTLGQSAPGDVNGLPLRNEFIADGRSARCAAARSKNLGRSGAGKTGNDATRTHHS